MPNDLKKEAQIFTKIKEKVAPSGRRKSKSLPTNWSPIRFMGKALLKRRSPNVYGKALTTIEKTDNIIRPVASKQKIYLAQMKKYMKSLSINGFMLAANRFVNEQKLINAAINKVSEVFSNISSDYGIKGKDPYIAINQAINISIGEKPESSELDLGKDVDEKNYAKSKIEEITEAVFIYESLCKQAAWEGISGWYWRGTKSGKLFKYSFRKIYSEFEIISNRNIATLEKLDDILDAGDPGEYLKQARSSGGFQNIDKVLGGKIAESWKILDSVYQSNIKEKAETKGTTDDVDIGLVEKPKEPPTAPATQEAARGGIIIEPDRPQPRERVIFQEKAPAPAGTAKTQLSPGAEPPPEEGAVDVGDEKKNVVIKNTHNEFINEIKKRAERGDDYLKIAKYILKYANRIEDIDFEYSEKLTHMVRDILDNE